MATLTAPEIGPPAATRRVFAGAGAVMVDDATQMRLDAIKERVDALYDKSFAFWTKYGPDPEHGGFYGILDESGAPNKTADKATVMQTRALYTFSDIYRTRNQSQKVKDIIDSVYMFARDSLRIRDNGCANQSSAPA